MKPYYYVYKNGGGAPKTRHESIQIAQDEAERLAEKHPGETFEILKCVALTCVKKPATTFWMDGEGPEQ